MLLIPLAFLALVLVPCAARADQANWEYMGTAKDVGAGGKVWKIGTVEDPGNGYFAERWNGGTSGNAWTQMAGSGVRIAVDANGNPWIVNAKNEIWRFNGEKFEQMPGSAKDIGIGGGRTWILGTKRGPHGYVVYRWTGEATGDNIWTEFPMSGVRIAVDDTACAWVVNDNNEIFRYNLSDFLKVGGSAKDVGAGGGTGAVWIVGVNPASSYGDIVYRWTGGSEAFPWTPFAGAGTDIAVDNTGEPWIVNAKGNLYHGHLDKGAASADCNGKYTCKEGVATVPGVTPAPDCTCKQSAVAP